MNLLQRFWYHPTIAQMQADMLIRPRLIMFMRRTTINQKKMTVWRWAEALR